MILDVLSTAEIMSIRFYRKMILNLIYYKSNKREVIKMVVCFNPKNMLFFFRTEFLIFLFFLKFNIQRFVFACIIYLLKSVKLIFNIANINTNNLLSSLSLSLSLSLSHYIYIYIYINVYIYIYIYIH